MPMNRKVVVLLPILLIVSACGASKSLMTDRYEKLETWQLCKKIIQDDLGSWQIPWATEVVKKRGERCEPYIGKFTPPPEPARPARNTSSEDSNWRIQMQQWEIKRKQAELERKQRSMEWDAWQKENERRIYCSNGVYDLSRCLK